MGSGPWGKSQKHKYAAQNCEAPESVGCQEDTDSDPRGQTKHSLKQHFQNIPKLTCISSWGQDPEVTWKLLTSCRGEVINGGFGLVLDGTQEAEKKAKMMLSWDVSNGVSHPKSLPCLLFLSVILPLPTTDLRQTSTPFTPEMVRSTSSHYCIFVSLLISCPHLSGAVSRGHFASPSLWLYLLFQPLSTQGAPGI